MQITIEIEDNLISTLDRLATEQNTDRETQGARQLNAYLKREYKNDLIKTINDSGIQDLSDIRTASEALKASKIDVPPVEELIEKES